MELKHKAKKKLMTSIGRTEEQDEDPIFTAVLFSVEHLLNELRDMKFKANGLAETGRQYNQSLVHLCGAGIKGNIIFNEQAMFIKSLRENLCCTLDRFVELDIPKMNQSVVAYKTSKLNYDTKYFQTIKSMGINDASGLDDKLEVVRSNPELSRLKQVCEDFQRVIINLRNVFKGRLDNDVTRALQQVELATTAERHHLWLKYFRSRVVITSAMCQAGTLSARTSAEPIKHSLLPQTRHLHQKKPENEQKEANSAISKEDPDAKGKLVCALMQQGTESLKGSNSALHACEEDSECYPSRRRDIPSSALGQVLESTDIDSALAQGIGSEIDCLYNDVPNPPTMTAPSIPRFPTSPGETISGISQPTPRSPSNPTIAS